VDLTYAHGTVIALRFDGEIFRANLEPHLAIQRDASGLALQAFGGLSDRFALERKVQLGSHDWIIHDEFTNLRERSRVVFPTNFTSSFFRLRKI
jgi:hypothetical protein